MRQWHRYARLRKRKTAGATVARRAAICAAVLIQLHLFLVAELHHHSSSLIQWNGSKPVAAQPAGPIWSTPQTPAAPDPNCAACRISIRGAVSMATAAPVPRALEATRIPSPATHLWFSTVAALLFSIRAPPSPDAR